MSGDYSKQRFRARNHYSGVLMQQGKVQLDSDWNEQSAIYDYDNRARTIDTIGRAVVPWETEHGFEITSDGSGGLDIHSGRMYVDGLLAENHGLFEENIGGEIDQLYYDASLEVERTTVPFPYDDQPYLIDAPALPAEPYLAYLDAWQREVTHLKDPGIIEKAVGIDTTTRMQTVWQVRAKAITSTGDPECPDTLSEWDSEILPSAGRLTTGTVPVNPSEDPCLIPPGGGYRGLENRLYRVEIHQGGPLGTATFKWARHNASVATTVTHIDGTELKIVQSQWDEFRRFEVGDWVEITDDKLEFAGLPGEMAKVDNVDYASNTITLTGVLSGDFPTSGIDKETDPTRHTRIRKWDQSGVVRGFTGTTSAVITDLAGSTDGLIPVQALTISVVLEDGVTVNFDLEPGGGEFKVGDYWLFAARTDDASVELLDKAPPEGIHHHYARLAIVTGAGIEDCRIHWPPELKDQTCCTVTVGDEVHSHGDYQTIQDAVKSLPAAGGKVCVLPGEYQENVVIDNRSNVIVEGCGKRSRVISAPPTEEFGEADPVIHIVNSQAIYIGALALEAHDSANGVLVEELVGDPDKPAPLPVEDIEMTSLRVQAATRSAIEVRAGKRISIANNTINMLDIRGDWPGIFLVGEDSLIENNTVNVESGKDIASTNDVGMVNVGRGGIQLGGTCDGVRVLDNLIQGGAGNGITLGSLQEVRDDKPTVSILRARAPWRFDPGKPCEPDTVYIPPAVDVDGSEPPSHYESTGPIYEIVIEHNRIYDMGLNGIGVVGFFKLDAVDEFITVEGLNIYGNEIRGCLNQPLAVIEEDMADSMGYGGIALADVEMLSIQHNVIEDNGEARTQEPVCGVFVLHAEGVEISDNRINNNGRRSQQESSPGPRGGIHVVFAVAPTVAISKGKFSRQNGVPAITVHNNIVVQPLGKALSMTALGPVSVTDNQFTSRGVISSADSLLSGIATVSIVNLGISDELYLQQLMTFSAIRQGKLSYAPTNTMQMAGQEGLDDRQLGRSLTNGNVLFNDNQCVCDLLGTPVTNIVLSSILIISLDDIAFHNNQCDCNLDLIGGYDLVLFPVFLFGLSVRMSDNRMKEGLLNALISAFSWGLFMNTATDNQATHCLIIQDAVLPNRTDNNHNIVFIDPTGGGFCEGFLKFARGQ